jgi:hypothetical protein
MEMTEILPVQHTINNRGDCKFWKWFRKYLSNIPEMARLKGTVWK